MTRDGRTAQRHGYVVIDKPAGWTSHDVVARVRRIVGERRVGHAGTLDPMAVGVLPVAVGLATRTVEYLSGARKAYVADITFGIETDTADGLGRMVRSRDAASLTLSTVEAALPMFVGVQEQTPPLHSAIKVDGQRLYHLARPGQAVDVPSRTVTIHSLDAIGWRPPTLTVAVTCSKGTYVRALARDLGERLESGAFLSHLVRTATGPFSLADATTVEELPLLIERYGWSQVSFHPDIPLQSRPAVVLTEDEATAWLHGRPTSPRSVASGTVRVYDAGGEWLGVGDASAESLRPHKVTASSGAGMPG